MHEYSVSPDHANSFVTVQLTSGTITVLDDHFHEIVIHRRLYGDGYQEIMKRVPYLNYVSRHPRFSKNTRINSMMPHKMKQYLDSCAGTNREKILKILSELTRRTDSDSALQTVNQTLRY